MQMRRCRRCWPTPILSPSRPSPGAHTHTVDWNICEARLVPLPGAELAWRVGVAAGSQGFCFCPKNRGWHQKDQEGLQRMPRAPLPPAPPVPGPARPPWGAHI